MRRTMKTRGSALLIGMGLALTFPAVDSGGLRACTIFVLTDSTHTLFFNNEDYSNPVTRIWFEPAGAGYYGCTYVGFDDGWAQGGVNTKGLAFDWVAGFMDEWAPDSRMAPVRGNPSQRMLESCSTVEEAVAFYERNREPEFARAKILVADRTGASAIIGARNGKLHVERAKHSRGFGYGRRILDQTLNRPMEATVSNGLAILRSCLQSGPNATKYSNVFDLRSGDIYIYSAPVRGDAIELNLRVELQKGRHYYDIPRIGNQVGQPVRPLLNNMRRFLLDDFRPVPDREPKVTEHLSVIIQNAAAGMLRAEDFTPEFWAQLNPGRQAIQADLKPMGKLLSMTLVDRKNEGGQRLYRYLSDFENTRVLQLYILDERGKVMSIQSESAEKKIGTDQ